MNIYEDAELEQKLSQLTDQLGLLVLDLLLESIKKISAENLIRGQWQECAIPLKKQSPEF
jgi:hypothetical protein